MKKTLVFIGLVCSTVWAGGGGIVPLRGGSGGIYLEGHYTGTAYDSLSTEQEECTVEFDVAYYSEGQTMGLRFSPRKYVCPTKTYETPAIVVENELSKWAFWETLRIGGEVKGISTPSLLALEQLSETQAYFGVEIMGEYTALSEGVLIEGAQHAFYSYIKVSTK
jgi:hypothetical protein